MGYCVADFATGRFINYGDPVVGFLVSAELGSVAHPRNPVKANNRPTDRFGMQSFPLFGMYSDFGQMDIAEVDMKQLGVELALKMTGSLSWKDLLRTAHCPRKPAAAAQEPANFGLALMHRSTYDYLVSVGADANQKLDPVALDSQAQAAVNQILAFAEVAVSREDLFLTYIATCGQGSEEDMNNAYDGYRSWQQHESVANLTYSEGQQVLQVPGGVPLTVPPFGKFNGYNEPFVGDSLVKTLRVEGYRGFLVAGKRITSLRQIPRYAEQLELMWKLQRLLQAMDLLGISLEPSMYRGSSACDDARSAFQIAMLELQSLAEVEAIVNQGPYEASTELANLRQRISALKELAEKLERSFEGLSSSA